MHSPDPITLRAHAKLNLALAVGPPLVHAPHAGLHPICSWMHAIDLCDEVRIEPASSASAFEAAWEGGGPVEWPAEHDLARRAHLALESAVGRPLPARIRLTKRIPAGGGLGGGSSDAAAVLLGLNDLLGLGLDEPALHAIGATLGSDIPFFLDAQAHALGEPPRPAMVSGVGQGVERLPRTDGEVTLLVPPFGCPTGAVYRAFDARPAPPLDPTRVLAAIDEGSAGWFNDLAGAAAEVEPRLGDLRRLLGEAGLEPHVSGSGSTLFLAGRHEPEVPEVRVVWARLV